MKPTLSWPERRARDLRALVHYRPRQIVGRVAILARRRATSLAPGPLRARLASLRRDPPSPSALAASEPFLAYALDPAVTPPERAEDLLAGRFTFLGESRLLGGRPDWNARGAGGPSHLWRMNLHYHRFLADAAAEARRRPASAGALLSRAAALLDDWTDACPAGAREGWADAWNSYAASTRLLNAWVAWLLLRDLPGGPALELRRRLEGHAASTAAFLERWLEVDLGGNHLLRNAAALTAAGRWFGGEPGARWGAVGTRLLRAELAAQLLPDGMHEERSPMYHALALEELLLAAFAPAGPGERDRDAFAEAASRMRTALRSVLHPDGEIALFNDGAFGIAPPPAVLERLADGLGAPRGGAAGDLPDAGYFRFEDGGEVLLFDAGPLGPDHLPAHAHADALSFEWSCAGRRVVTDTGVDRYEAGAERDFQRSTAAHATLQVDGLDQAECFSSFRIGRRPRVAGRRASPGVVEGSHDGFGAQAVHRRRLEWHGEAGFAWTDGLSGSAPRAATVRLPLAPEVLVRLEGGAFRLDLPGGRAAWVRVPAGGSARVEEGVYCPRFGERLPRPVLRWDGRLGGGAVARFEVTREPATLTP